MNRRISIIGGGIGGLTMALSLQKQGIPFHLYEKTDAFREVGAGVGISSNALTVFDHLGIGDAVRNSGYLLESSILADEKLSVLKRIPFDDEVYCIHRAELVQILSENLDASSYSLNKSLHNVSQSHESISLTFEDHSEEQTDILIAADGINSVVRNQVFPDLEKRGTNHFIWRGITRFPIPKQYLNTYHELIGNGMRFLFLNLDHERVFWLAIKKGPAVLHPGQSLKDFLTGLYKNYDPLIPELIASTEPSVIIENELEDIKPEYSTWHKNNIVFIGDSIHATTPNLAQGANQAIEDAYTLALCFSKYEDSRQAFVTYQNLRMEKVKYIVNQSWAIGNAALSDSRIREKLVQLFFRLTPVSFYHKQYNKLIDVSYFDSV